MAREGNWFTYDGQDYLYRGIREGTRKGLNRRTKVEYVVETAYTVWSSVCAAPGCQTAFEVTLPYNFPIGSFRLNRRCDAHKDSGVPVDRRQTHVPDAVKRGRAEISRMAAHGWRSKSAEVAERHRVADEYILRVLWVNGATSESANMMPSTVIEQVFHSVASMNDDTKKLLAVGKPRPSVFAYFHRAYLRLRAKGLVGGIGGGRNSCWYAKVSRSEYEALSESALAAKLADRPVAAAKQGDAPRKMTEAEIIASYQAEFGVVPSVPASSKTIETPPPPPLPSPPPVPSAPAYTGPPIPKPPVVKADPNSIRDLSDWNRGLEIEIIAPGTPMPDHIRKEFEYYEAVNTVGRASRGDPDFRAKWEAGKAAEEAWAAVKPLWLPLERRFAKPYAQQ